MTTARVFYPLLVILAAAPNFLTAQTSVTLSSPGGASIFGAPVVLTATVTPATATGKVTFYDGVNILGTKPLVSGAASVSTILLTSGTHKVTAYYGGDGSNAAATSNSVTQTVTAQFSAGFAIRSPSGTIVTGVLAMADFNGDGKADLVVRNGGLLTVLQGDGTGSFQNTFNLTTAGLVPVAAAAGDFNGDGKTDLALASSASSNVFILLGNGDGTFQAPTTFAVPNLLQSLAVADFNGDGKADIVTADPGSGVNILLGKGDGTFQAAVPYTVNPGAGSGSQAAFVLVGDFNGDGKPDVVTINANSSTLSTLLGVGDGTLQSPTIFAIPAQALRLVAGDFNGDTKTDLATNNGFVLLGKGDGTFQPAVTYPTGSSASSVAVGDFDGDGKPDLVFSDGLVSVLAGKGDGTFQAPVTYVVGSGASTVLVGEFNSDGKTDLAVASNNTVSFMLGTTVTVTATQGTPQSTPVSTPFPKSLQVTVKDGPNPVSGVTVTFTAPSGVPSDQAPAGSATAILSSNMAVTDSNGVASVTATANGLAGSYTVTATALGVITPFALTNLATQATTITPSPATPQSTLVGTAFPKAFQVTLTDFAGLPASGVTVTFAAPSTGASAILSSQTVVTNAAGTASVTATANNTPGSYTLTATAGNLSASFSLTNLQTVTVTLSSSGSPINLGTPLTLTAAISNPAATGKITFFDGVAILGTKQATAGSAVLSVLLSPGVHKLTAFYRDDTNAAVGTSAAISQTVKAAAGGAFITQAPMSGRPTSSTVVAADFNGDHILDIAFPAFINAAAAVTVNIGVGDGTLLNPVYYTVGGASATAIVAGDFNGDGNTDLAVATFTNGISSSGIANVNILLGNGDGTFRQPSNFAAGTNLINTMVVADLNGDGRADLVLAYSGGHGVNVLYGFGDGTFGQPAVYTALSLPMVVADFNGDGKADLALGNASASPTVLLGNGDGTTQNPIVSSLGVSASATSLVAGDFNGDGKVDLAVGGQLTGSNTPTTWILLGNGDGTFQPAVSYSQGAAVASGDFNGDGFLDLVVADASNNTVGILQGKGDGTFQSGPPLSTATTMAVGDFNGDAKEDLFTANFSTGNTNILLGATNVSFSVTATGGGGQFAALGTPFTLPLQVTVLNNGIPLSGATISFTAPTSGASAILSAPTAITNASGIASITATANFVAGSYVVTATYQNLTATFALTNTTFAFITASGGTPQSATIGQAFTNPLQVTVKDGLGNPVNNVTVTFTAPTSGASATLSSGTAATNSSGIASVTATANTTAGNYNVTAKVGNLTATFALTNIAGAAASIAATAGTPQTTVTGTAFATALQATVKDAGGNPVSGVTVTFTAPSTGASATLSSATATTNSSGVASVTATANGTAGSYTVSAATASFSTSFALTNTAIGSITPTGGSPQTALLGAAFASPLQVTVKDTAGNPVNNVIVNFSAPTVGASATLSSSAITTNSSGVASVTATANNIAGTYNVTASVGTLSTIFTLTNSSGPPASLTIFGGTLQSALVDTAFSSPLQVAAKDASGLPVVGAIITFTAPTVGASAALSSTTATTNSLGIASVTAAANNIPGSYLVSASVGGLSVNFSLTNLLGGTSNLALGRTATQSSTFPGSPGPSAAVDGRTDGNYFNGSVTATNPDTNAWWQVDLGASASISSITIWNRTDCCGTRLSDFWVFISNTPFLATDTPATLQNRAGTIANHQTSAPSPSTTIPFASAQGRYVRVQLSGTDYLSLAEVQVSGTGGAPTPTNLAMGRATAQSSTFPGYASAAASSAVDGNTDGNFFDNSVTATNADTNAWWQVDLGVSSTINTVVLWNRTDCCNTRLSDFWVFVSDAPFLPTDTPSTLQNRTATFATHLLSVPSPSVAINVGVQGRYVRVQLSSTNILSLAEVQVMGTGPQATNLSQGKSATQSSTLPGSTGASAAVDGSTDGAFFDGSVTATNPDTNAWWQVDLGASAAISSVIIYNRTDCCGTRLSDYWVFISDTPFLASDTPATLQSRAGTFAIHQTSAPNPSTTITLTAQGRYVRVQLSGTDYLSLAEVQVFGVSVGPTLSNLARGKAATQSSNLFMVAGAPGLAVDGNTDGNLFDGSVSTTNLDPNPWWQVDLGASATVSSVIVYNRTDCCGTRLSDFWVFVSNTPFQANDTPTTLQSRAGTFSSHQTTAPNPSVTIPVNAPGRYVRVQLSSANYLSLAEVQVYGQ